MRFTRSEVVQRAFPAPNSNDRSHIKPPDEMINPPSCIVKLCEVTLALSRKIFFHFFVRSVLSVSFNPFQVEIPALPKRALFPGGCGASGATAMSEHSIFDVRFCGNGGRPSFN